MVGLGRETLLLGWEDWRVVVFSDESKFNLFGSDGREWCWRRPGEAHDTRYTKKKLKHGGGNVMVWGCVTRYGVGELHRIDGTMDQFLYVKILQRSLLHTLDKHNLDHKAIYFQQDLDPKHTSNHAKGWFDFEGLDVLPWSPNSPDMNPHREPLGPFGPNGACQEPTTNQPRQPLACFEGGVGED